MNGIPDDKYSICPETGLRVCQIFDILQVREDGMFRFTVRVKGSPARMVWGTNKPNGEGYILCHWMGKGKSITKRLHRLVAQAFVLYDREDVGIDKSHIDHIDGNRTNNNASNLRWVTQRENLWNLERHRNGGLWGCIEKKDMYRTKKWCARVNINRKPIHCGYFLTQLEAHQAACKKADELGIPHPPMQTEEPPCDS